MPTRYNIARKAIDEAISMSHNKAQLEYALRDMGYSFMFNDKRKYWTVTLKDDSKPIRLYRLGNEYTNERILERLKENRDNINFAPFQPKQYVVRQYRLSTRSTKIKKVGGLYGLYLHYCYKLGYLPNYKKQNPARLHYLLRDDLMKLDRLTEQVTLLGRNHIGTDEQLFSFKQSVEAEIKNLLADRTHLRNEIRKVNITDAELSEAKEKISAITERLKTLRKEIKVCDSIAERSGVMRKNLETVIADEEKSNRKERQRYDKRR